MWYEGWNKRSIAGCLTLSRTHVYTILDAFERDGIAGLEEQRTRPPQHPGNQLTLPFLKEALDIQREYPRAGRFRVHGLLERRREEPPPSEATVGRAMAINRQFHGAPGPWASAWDEEEPDTTPQAPALSATLSPSYVVHGHSVFGPTRRRPGLQGGRQRTVQFFRQSHLGGSP